MMRHTHHDEAYHALIGTARSAMRCPFGRAFRQHLLHQRTAVREEGQIQGCCLTIRSAFFDRSASFFIDDPISRDSVSRKLARP
jgi:hypothetical protein